LETLGVRHLHCEFHFQNKMKNLTAFMVRKFDGDEMNLHMPQDVEAESELRNLAAVPYQIISPANNSPIIGIYQDSMLGCNRFTREGIRFTPREAMNILMMFQRVNEKALNAIIEERGVVTNFELMSQILPPLSLKYNTKLFKDGEDKSKSNNVLEIKDGQYLRGQMEKGVLGGGTKGLIQRICNDFGNFASANFIDDLQNIITEYMKSSAYSVGISDLIADEKTNQDIIKIITDKKMDVKKLIDQTQIGVFENKTGKTNEEEFETQVNNILNQASSEAGKVGLTSLSKDNRFVIMVSAGSKGSDLNISQMISCLGQQNVDGKRIPYGFDHRTLPHFTKYDDSPSARGFVESSYINGLNPQELFFHAMGGRVGLIDTAVKTSTTGYIQRRLIKGLEDLMVSYDMTVRTNKGKLVQFAYGDDGIDPVKVENQSMPLVSMSIQDIYAHYNIPDESGKTKALSSVFLKPTLARYKKQMKDTQEKCKFYTDLMIQNRDLIVKNVFKNKSDSVVNCPVAFSYIINNVIGQQNINASSVTDLTPLEAFDMIEKCYSNLEKIRCAVPTALFKTLYFYYLSPKDLLFVKRFNKAALTVLLENVAVNYKRAIVAPGEMVGMVAAQSIGEPTTQMSALKCEHIRCVKINKNTKEISMVSGEIGPMCDALIEQYPQYTFGTGHVDSVETILDGVEDEYYIIGVDTEEKTHWNKISHVSRHPVNGNVMKVTTKSGRIVSTTTSHSHLIRDEKTQTVVPITGANMKEGMRIPVAKHIDNTFVKDSVTIGTTVQKLDHLFGWFIGAYLAEGNLNKKTGTQNVNGSINITNISSHFIENAKKFAARFGKDCRVVERECEYGPSVITSFSCKPLADFLLATCDNGSFVKRVPDFAFLAPNEFKAGLIQAYFDGDGNFQCDEGHHQIRVCSRSKQLTKDMALMLNYFDIFGSIKENFTRGSNIYNLAISAKYSRQYQESIGSQLHAEKLQELVDYIDRDSAHDLSDEIDKINGLGAIIAKCGKTLKLPGQSRNYGRWAKKDSIGRRTLQKYIQIFDSHENSSLIKDELCILNQAANSGVVWDEIKKIEVWSPEQTEYVYDFTVPGNQTFMTDYGIIIHNTLNTFHFAGVSSKSNVTRGVPRIEEILSLSSDPKNPSLTVFLKPEDEADREKAQSIMYMLEHTKMKEVVASTEICFDPDDLNTLINDDESTMQQFRAFENMVDECMETSLTDDTNEKSKWILRMEMNAEVMLEKNITMDDVNFTLKNSFGDEISCVYSDYNSDKLVFRIRMNNVVKQGSNKGGAKKTKVNPLDQSDQIYLLKNFQDQLLENIVLRGIKRIKKVILRKIKDNVVEQAGVFKKKDIWVLDTIGTNMMDVLALDYIDPNRTFSNDIVEIYETFGIEAARQAIYNELADVIEFDGTYINFHHLSILCDRMTFTNKMISIFRHGINNDNIGPIAKASFEETPEMFLRAARHAELDTLRGVSANVMCGQEGLFGTNAFQVVLDLEEMRKLEEVAVYEKINEEESIEKLFGGVENPDDQCSSNKLTIQNNVVSIKSTDLGQDNTYNPGF
jgi:DNA-directed RNA polymerase beta' subunit